jgi:hypothetical protein
VRKYFIILSTGWLRTNVFILQLEFSQNSLAYFAALFG